MLNVANSNADPLDVISQGLTSTSGESASSSVASNADSTSGDSSSDFATVLSEAVAPALTANNEGHVLHQCCTDKLNGTVDGSQSDLVVPTDARIVSLLDTADLDLPTNEAVVAEENLDSSASILVGVGTAVLSNNVSGSDDESILDVPIVPTEDEDVLDFLPIVSGIPAVEDPIAPVSLELGESNSDAEEADQHGVSVADYPGLDQKLSEAIAGQDAGPTLTLTESVLASATASSEVARQQVDSENSDSKDEITQALQELSQPPAGGETDGNPLSSDSLIDRQSDALRAGTDIDSLSSAIEEGPETEAEVSPPLPLTDERSAQPRAASVLSTAVTNLDGDAELKIANADGVDPLDSPDTEADSKPPVEPIKEAASLADQVTADYQNLSAALTGRSQATEGYNEVSLSAVEPADVTRQVVDAVLENMEVTGDMDDTLTVRLDPPELGEITLEMESRGSRTILKVTAAESSTQSMLQSSVAELKASDAAGSSLAEFEFEFNDQPQDQRKDERDKEAFRHWLVDDAILQDHESPISFVA